MSKVAVLVAVAALAVGGWLGSPSTDGSSASSPPTSQLRPVLGGSPAPVSKRGTGVDPVEAELERDLRSSGCHGHRHPSVGALVGPSDHAHDQR